MHAVRQRDHVGGSLNVLVKAVYRVKVCQLAFTLQKIAEPLLTRAKVLRNACNVGRQRVRALSKAKHVAQPPHSRVRLVNREMRCIVLPIRHRLLPIAQQCVIDLVVQFLINLPHRVPRAFELYIAFRRDLDPVVLDIVRGRAVLPLEHHLHQRAFVLVKIQRRHTLPVSAFQFVSLRNSLVHRLKVCLVQRFRLRAVLLTENIKDISLHRLSLIGKPVHFVLCMRRDRVGMLCRFQIHCFAPLRVRFVDRAACIAYRLFRFICVQ